MDLADRHGRRKVGGRRRPCGGHTGCGLRRFGRNCRGRGCDVGGRLGARGDDRCGRRLGCDGFAAAAAGDVRGGGNGKRRGWRVGADGWRCCRGRPSRLVRGLRPAGYDRRWGIVCANDVEGGRRRLRWRWRRRADSRWRRGLSRCGRRPVVSTGVGGRRWLGGWCHGRLGGARCGGWPRWRDDVVGR